MKIKLFLLIFIFFPVAVMVGGIENSIKAVNEKAPSLDDYTSYIYRHENSYVKNMGYSAQHKLTWSQAESIVLAAAIHATDIWSIDAILAQLERESHYILKARSYKNAIGISQVMDHLWRGHSPRYRKIVLETKNLYDPYVAIEAQVFILNSFYLQNNKVKAKTYASYSGGAINYYQDIENIKKKLKTIKNSYGR